ncbi:MAG: tetratricopeptide repeat protein [Calditrichaeota bacterium]|nr:MAG: tetratricopeptide repeat protein [Calditrichota bacterium]
MRFTVILILFISIISMSVLATTPEIEQDLVAENWESAFELLQEKGPENTVDSFLFFQLCYQLDCKLDVVYPEMNQKGFQEFHKWGKRFVDKYPDALFSHLVTCDMNIMIGEIQRGIEAADRAIYADSSFYPAYNAKYMGLIMSGMFQEALQVAKAVLHQKEDHVIGLMNCGVISDELGEHKKAIEYYKKAEKLHQGSSMLYYNMGNSYRAIDSDSLALMAYSQAIELDKENVYAHLNRGNTYADLQDNQKAIEDYQYFVDNAPDNMISEKEKYKNIIKAIQLDRDYYDEETILKIAETTLNAWKEQNWDDLADCMHPMALQQFKEAGIIAMEQMYEGKDQSSYVIVFGKIVKLSDMRTLSTKQFFVIQAEMFTDEKSNFRSQFLISDVEIKSIENPIVGMASVELYTTFLQGQSIDDQLGFILDGTEWKALLPTPFMGFVAAVMESR